jgi:hypothetical protein
MFHENNSIPKTNWTSQIPVLYRPRHWIFNTNLETLVVRARPKSYKKGEMRREIQNPELR